MEFFPEKNDPNEDYYISGDDKTLISCFSSRYDSILMWSHYAENHRGICIGYDVNKYIDLIYPVSYQEDYSNNCSKNVNDVGYSADCAKLIKSKEWSYEQEWRIILTEYIRNMLGKIRPTINNFTKITEFPYCKIYLGAKFQDNLNHPVKKEDKEYAEKLLAIANKYNIPCVKMKMEYGKFKLSQDNT